MKKLILKVICKIKGHYWIYKSPHNTYHKVCYRCGKKIRNEDKIIDGKLVKKNDFDTIYEQFGWDDIKDMV